MKKLFQWFHKYYTRNIQTRITLYFLLILLPLVIVSLFAIERSRDIIYDQAVQRTEVALSSTMNYIDLALQHVEEISTLIASDLSIIELMNKHGSDLPAQAILDFSVILEQLSNMNSVNRFVSQIAMYHHESHMILSTNFGGRRVISEPQQEWLVKTARTISAGIQYVPSSLPVTNELTFGQMIRSDSISLVRSMDLYNTARQPNLLMVTFNKNKLMSVIKTLLPSERTTVLLYNDKGELVVSTSHLDQPPIVSEHEMAVLLSSKYSQWNLTLIQPKKELYVETDQLRMFTLTIIIVSVLLASVVSWVVYSGIAAPVKKLSRGMRQLRSGKFNVTLDYKHKDEFGFLIESFNRMAVDQKHLIEDHYEQRLRVATTELKFLQSQINPHFLYNTLDSIYWTAKNYDAEEISEMVMNLSNFFRLSLNKGSDLFSIEESLIHLHYYIRIQQLRFLDPFTVEYQIDEACKSVLILKLLLQPLVENAILHGLEGKRDGGVLRITSWIDNKSLLNITVQDNGKGMTLDRLHYIQQEFVRMSTRSFPTLSQDEEHVKDLYGLRNVYTRMRLYYGKESNLSITSKLGEGTDVILIIPLDRCELFFPSSRETSTIDL